MKNKKIKKLYEDWSHGILYILSSMSEHTLRELFATESLMNELMDIYKEHNDVAYFELLSFSVMFANEYRKPGSWRCNHSRWLEKYKKYEI